MSNEKPVPETFETIAASIRELRTYMDTRFDRVDARFGRVDQSFTTIDERFTSVDKRFDELEALVHSEIAGVKSQLRTEIEAVRGDVKLVAEAFGAQLTRNEQNDKDHAKFEECLDTHDVRILALEPKTPA